jgi:hypothetical protein
MVFYSVNNKLVLLLIHDLQVIEQKYRNFFMKLGTTDYSSRHFMIKKPFCSRNVMQDYRLATHLFEGCPRTVPASFTFFVVM